MWRIVLVSIPVNDLGRMRQQLERFCFRVSSTPTLSQCHIYVAIIWVVITAFSISCGSMDDLPGSDNRKPDYDFPLPGTTPIIKAQPSSSARDSALETTALATSPPAAKSSPTEEINLPQAEMNDDLQPTATVQQLAVDPYLGMWLTRERTKSFAPCPDQPGKT